MVVDEEEEEGVRLRALEVGLLMVASALAADVSVITGAKVMDARGKTTAADWGKVLKAYIMNGVTTVADLRTYPERLAPMRKLIAGNAAAHIEDIRKVSRICLGGMEQDRVTLAAAISAPALRDDFESADGRSRVDKLWLNNTDSGSARARMSYQRTLRRADNHARTVLSEMPDEEHPSVSMALPLSAGGLLPVDASRFKRIEFEARGVMDRRFFRNGFEGQA